MEHPIVTFTSDFGDDDWFVGVVHGVIHELCPAARVVDLTHRIPPGDVERAGFVLESATPDFARGSVHLVVVDPGVGTARRAIAARARDQLFVGPDNGVLEWALSASDVEVRQLTETHLFRQPVSRTFHGRDVFGPVAARLAAGLTFDAVGAPVGDPIRHPAHLPEISDHHIRGRVAFVDRFGNVFTNITERDLDAVFGDTAHDHIEVEAVGRTIHGITGSYGDAAVGAMIALIGSSGRLEIAQVRGDASQRLGLALRDEVRVHLRG
jgi:S-adenosylmethionine hydrolase